MIEVAQPVARWRMERQQRLVVEAERKLFDPTFYAFQVAEVFSSDDVAWEHYRRSGARDRLSPNRLFDAAWYAHIYPDVVDIADVFEHYLGAGQAEGRSPHSLFDPDWYETQHAASTICRNRVDAPWQHFLECPDTELTCTPLWHPMMEPGAVADRSTFMRYLAGDQGGVLSPHSCFDTDYFLATFGWPPAGISPLHLYASRVGDERARADPNLLVSQAWYLGAHAATLQYHQSPLAHYLKRGRLDQFHPYLPFEVWERCGNGTPDLLDLMQRSRWAEPTRQIHAAAGGDVDALVIDIDNGAITVASVLFLRAASTGLDVRVHVLDNASASRDEAAHLLRYLPDAQVIRSEDRRSFGESNNILAEQGRAPLLLLLNNDAFLPAQSLDRLVSHVRDSEDVVAVGPAFVFPDGRIQEVGGQFCDDGTPVQLAKGFDSVPDVLSQPHRVDYISAACFLVRRDAYLAVGGFSFVFEPAYYEDTDLCRRLVVLGAIVVLPDVRVVHFEGHSTGNENVLPNKSAIQKMSRDKFLARDWLAVAEEVRGRAVATRSEATGLQSAVLFSEFGLMMGGGERYLLSLAASLSRSHVVSLAFPGPYSQLRLGNIQDALGLDIQTFPLIDVTRRPLSRLACDLFVNLGNSFVPHVAPVGRKNLYVCQFPFDDAHDVSVDAAQRLLVWDEVFVYSEFARTRFMHKARRVGASTVPSVVAPPCTMLSAGDERDQLEIVTVGRFFEAGHSKRQDVAVAALRELVEAGVPARLHVVGGVSTHDEARTFFARVQSSAKGLPVNFYPDATRQQLARIVGRSLFYWHCSGLGVPMSDPERMEHFGISVVEAMAAGCVPVVADRGGPAAFVSEVDPSLLATGAPDYARLTGALWKDPARRRQLAEKAAVVAQRYSHASFAEAVSDAVARLA
jgi:GT2 family glycosyltransferase/glycosyltransferase involved in cell wall biosynthesis